MIASERGIRRVPSLRSEIHLTTGARMYAMRAANTNGSSTARPQITISTMNSGKPQRLMKRHTGFSLPNSVCERVRVGGGVIGAVVDDVVVIGPVIGSVMRP